MKFLKAQVMVQKMSLKLLMQKWLLVFVFCSSSPGLAQTDFITQTRRLEKSGEWRQIVVESLRELQNMNSQAVEAEPLRLWLLKAVHQLILRNRDNAERTWTDWALGFRTHRDSRERMLSFSGFLDDFPHSSAAAQVLRWEKDVVADFLRRENEVVQFYLRQEKPFAALVRAEGFLRNPGVMRHSLKAVVQSILEIRLFIEDRLDDFEDSELKQIHDMGYSSSKVIPKFERRIFAQKFRESTRAMEQLFKKKFGTQKP